jgi:hypothetical protein
MSVTKKTYSDKLKDPRWQKKRLEILERDEWACRACTSTKDTLHVHHIKYEKSHEPWEAQDDELITLCESCHDIWHYLFNGKKCPDTICLVAELYSDLEWEKIQKWLKKNKK